MKTYDVIIIGAGSAGLSARKEVSRWTDRYLVVDPGPLGTTCARVGCMPSKVLMEAAHIFSQSQKFSRIGVKGSEGLSLNSKILMEHVRSLRDAFVESVIDDLDEWRQDHFLPKKATFVTNEILDLEGERVQAEKIIIATGSQPVIPAIWSRVSGVLTTDSLFELSELPKKMAVIGFGAIGLEMSQALARVGVEISVFKQGDSVGSGLTDPEITQYAREVFGKEMTIYDEAVLNLRNSSGRIQLQTAKREVEFDQALVAIGRKPNLEGLGLEKLGLALDDRGVPLFSEQTFRIQDSNLYLVGDVNESRPLLHEAAEQGRIAGHNSVQDTDQEFAPQVPMGITFSFPQIASVGTSYQQLKEQKIDFVEGSVSFENQGRAKAKLENKGLLKVYGDRRTGTLLGAEIFAPEGEHLAHLLAWSMESHSDVFQLLLRPFYHPVLEEALRTALRRMARQVEKPCSETEFLKCEDPPVGS